MARNGSGTMSVTNTFAAGATITAAGHNQNNTDIAAELTNSVAADGQTTMSGPLKAAAGSVSVPSYTFGADQNTGAYNSAPDEYSISAGGMQIVKVSSTGLDVPNGGLSIAGVPITAAGNGTALSVYGVTGNASAARADIAASVDGYVMRRSGTAIGFGTVATAGIADAAVTLAKQANLSQGNFIGRYTSGSGVPQACSFGTTLALNASTGALDVAAPNALVYISNTNVSGASAVPFGGIDGTYREYVIAIDAAVPATDGVQLIAEISLDGGSTWKTTGYIGSAWGFTSAGGSANGGLTSAIALSRAALGNTSAYGFSGSLTLHAPSTTGNKIIRTIGGYLQSGATVIETIHGATVYNGSTSAINAIRFRMSSGNIATGTFYIYGIKGS